MEGQPRLEASDEFHRRLVRRIQTDDHVPRYGARSPIFDWLIASRWKIAFSTAAAALLVAGALQFRLQIEPALPISSNSKPKAVAVPRADFQPSFLAYRQAVNKSPEALDALLALDATKSTGSVRAITAAMRELAGLTD